MEDLIYRIFNRKLLITVDDIEYTILSPTAELRYRGELYKNKLIKSYKYDLPLLEDYMRFLINARLIDTDHETKTKNMNDSIRKYKVELYKCGPKIEQEKRVRKSLNFTRDKLNEYLTKIEFYRRQSLEYFADGLKNKFLLINTTYKDNELVFNQNNIDVNLFTKVIDEINKQDIDMETFRNIARSDFWISYWRANKNNVFGIPPLEYTEEQRMLSNFSRMYDSMFESLDFGDEILGDSDKEDGFLIHQQEKYKNEKQPKTDLDPRFDEIFAAAETDKEANKIYDTNSFDSKRILKERAAVIKSKESVRDINFKDRQLEILENNAAQEKKVMLGG